MEGGLSLCGYILDPHKTLNNVFVVCPSPIVVSLTSHSKNEMKVTKLLFSQLGDLVWILTSNLTFYKTSIEFHYTYIFFGIIDFEDLTQMKRQIHRYLHLYPSEYIGNLFVFTLHVSLHTIQWIDLRQHKKI